VNADDWLRTYRPRPGARWRLFCLPHASGNATFYRDWASKLPAEIEVVAIQYPGRLDRISEPCVPDMDTMVDSIVTAMSGQARDSFAIFGHSMGASIAYEVAYRLEHRLGTPPERLFVSGRPAPRHHRPGTKHLGTDDFLWDELRRLGGTDEAALAHKELRAALMPSLRADYRLVETYQPTLGPPITVPVTAFTGDRDPEALVPEVADWEQATTGPFDLKVFPGEHFYLVPEAEGVLSGIVKGLNSPAR
jgi:pyochelin biosynthetic protein PchC